MLFLAGVLWWSVLPESAGLAQAQTFSITGRVDDTGLGTGVPIPSVTMTLRDPGSGTTLATQLTDAGGNYSFTGLAAGGNFEVVPSKTGFVFHPVNRGFFNLSQSWTSQFFQGTSTTPATNSVQFSSASYGVSESNRSVQITVNRTGDTSASASVFYQTTDGTANDRADYLAALGTLTFAAGETSKAFIIFITDDVYGEGTETLNLSLSNPAGTSVGSPGTATLTITSDETVNGLNPMRTTTNGVPSFNADFFVRQQYLDFFNREGDQPGIDFWRGQITACGADQPCIDFQKERVSSEFFRSIEFQTTGYFVYRAFAAAFGPNRIGGTVPLTLREFLPDTQQIGRGVIVGAPGWEAQIEANRVSFINDFVSRSQFTSQHPSGTQTPAQFIDALNANTGGSLSQAERDQLVNQLAGGQMTRAQAFRSVIEDVDFATRERNRAFVLMQYFGYLRRNPPDSPELTLDYQGYNFWLGKLNQFNGDAVAAQMVKAFVVSEEYKLRFGP